MLGAACARSFSSLTTVFACGKSCAVTGSAVSYSAVLSDLR